MGLDDFTIYFDSCLAIYLVEENVLYASKLETKLANYPTAKICISALSEMECLILPLRQQNQSLIVKFEKWFTKVTILPIEREIFQKAAQLRADFASLKTPDALHISTALHHNCDEFWTIDNRLDKIAPNLVKNIL